MKKIITKLVAAVIQDVYAPRLIQSLGASNKIVTDTITIKICQIVSKIIRFILDKPTIFLFIY